MTLVVQPWQVGVACQMELMMCRSPWIANVCLAVALAPFIAGCNIFSDSSTSPTATANLTEMFSGTLAQRSSSFYTFTVFVGSRQRADQRRRLIDDVGGTRSRRVERHNQLRGYQLEPDCGRWSHTTNYGDGEPRHLLRPDLRRRHPDSASDLQHHHRSPVAEVARIPMGLVSRDCA